MSSVVIYGDELYHYGVKGQKWGTRRYQNSDGSLTSEGRAHYGYSTSGNGKNKFSLKATGNRALANIYGLNAKVYSKSNKTLSSMNTTAKNAALKRAEEAQKEANSRKGLSKNAKTALKVAAGVAGAAALGYGAYKLSKYTKTPSGQAMLNKAKEKFDKARASVQRKSYTPRNGVMRITDGSYQTRADRFNNSVGSVKGKVKNTINGVKDYVSKEKAYSSKLPNMEDVRMQTAARRFKRSVGNSMSKASDSFNNAKKSAYGAYENIIGSAKKKAYTPKNGVMRITDGSYQTRGEKFRNSLNGVRSGARTTFNNGVTAANNFVQDTKHAVNSAVNKSQNSRYHPVRKPTTYRGRITKVK